MWQDPCRVDRAERTKLTAEPETDCARDCNHNLPPNKDPFHSVTLRLSVKPTFTLNIVLGKVDDYAKCGSVDDVELWHSVTISLREHIPS
jgi:hypothetical protein